MVAVCPPKDSNTALYHDLAKLGNIPFSEKDREVLKGAINNIFMESPHRKYVRSLLATPTSGDLIQLYQGFQSLPKPYNFGKGFEVKIWNTNGTIATPFYGEEFVREYYTLCWSFLMTSKTKFTMDPSTSGWNSKPEKRKPLMNQ